MENLHVNTKENENDPKYLEIVKNKYSGTPLLTPYKSKKNSKIEEPNEFNLEENENLKNLMNGLSLLSNLNDIEKAEETYKDQLTTIHSHFRRQCSMAIAPSELNELEKSTNITIDKSDQLEFDKIEIIERPNPKSLVFKENKEACYNIAEIIRLRKKYLFSDHCDYCHEDKLIDRTWNSESTEPFIDYSKEIELLPKMTGVDFITKDGVFELFIDKKILTPIPSMAEFINDLAFVVESTHNSINKSFCNNRLEILEEKFKMHLLYNREKEMLEQQAIHHRDFYNIRKIDTHIHHSACMRAKHLLRFMREKFKNEGEEDVLIDKQTNKTIKLKEVIEKLGLAERDLNLDSLNVQADASIFERFDRFNNKYNPLGQSDLREIFLKTDNFIKGKYLAEISKQVMKYLEKEKYGYAEWRISIYGKSLNEWQKLAIWFKDYQIFNHHVRWMIQIPRLYAAYKKAGVIKNFQEMLDNLFKPLFDVTLNPAVDEALYRLLFQIVGFDTVDDESIYETLSLDNLALQPGDWNKPKNPHYAYWIYYFYANLYSLNHLRQMRGLNTFSFRPHCGESGNVDHLATAFLVADGINHGIKLSRAPVLQYLYYIQQIGIAMSPLSNNKLFLQYSKNPFPLFFARGLNVSLSTDDPLIIHLTKEPLVEEYAVAAQVWNLSTIDLAEIARNSVLQCSFEETLKKHWIGPNYHPNRLDGNDPEKTNLPQIRLNYRLDSLDTERCLIMKLAEIKDKLFL